MGLSDLFGQMQQEQPYDMYFVHHRLHLHSMLEPTVNTKPKCQPMCLVIHLIHRSPTSCVLYLCRYRFTYYLSERLSDIQ